MTTPYSAADGLVRVYPAPRPDGSGLVWAHGGGFAAGDLDMPEADGVARGLAERGTTVVSVDYRLVGAGCRFPVPSDDVLSAWSWALANARDLGVDRLALGGASAGGNLVAGAVLRLLAGGGPVPAMLVLAYPTLLAVQPAPDAALRALLDADPDADRFGPDTVRAMYENFLGDPVDDAPLAAVPGRATIDDVAGFPPTLMINGEADELRVSGEVFARTLAAAGRDVEVRIEPGTTHGHLNRPGPAASASLDLIAERLSALPPTTASAEPADRAITPSPHARSAD